MKGTRRVVPSLLVAVAVTACGGGAGTAGEAGGSGAAEVPGATAAIDSLFVAMNSGSADAVLSHYADRADFQFVGCTNVRSGFAGFVPIVRSYYRGQERHLTHRVIGVQPLGSNVAVVTAQGSGDDASGLFWTWVLQRVDGQWKIVHEHESWQGCPPPRGEHPGLDETGAAPDSMAPDNGM